MPRQYHVKIKDASTGKIIAEFTGVVVRKEQSRGRIAGPVKETLHVERGARVEVK